MWSLITGWSRNMLFVISLIVFFSSLFIDVKVFDFFIKSNHLMYIFLKMSYTTMCVCESDLISQKITGFHYGTVLVPYRYGTVSTEKVLRNIQGFLERIFPIWGHIISFVPFISHHPRCFFECPQNCYNAVSTHTVTLWNIFLFSRNDIKTLESS